ncbi:MAG: glycosyltransferase family 4 protein [bacterium]|nr:glycosyltransferase family 4 protein [bacterium]
MKVLLTAIHTGGGIRTFLRYIYGHPAFADCELRLVGQDATLGDYLAKFLPEGRMSVVATPLDNLATMRRIRQELRAQRYDLVHAHGFTAGVLTSCAGIGIRTPQMLTGHDLFHEAPFAGWKGRLRKLGVGLAYSRVGLFHMVTTDARDNFRRFFPRIDGDRFHTVVHGIDTQFFAGGTPADLRADLQLAPETPLIGFFGRFMAPKGFRDLVDAVAIMAADPAVSPMPKIVTFGWGGFVREDFAYLEELGLEEHFIQVAHTDDMPGALKGVDVVAMPSRWEACGLLAMEALSAGAPIVGSSCSGLQEVLKESPAYVVAPRDPAALAEALKEALQRGRDAFTAYQATACERFSNDRAARGIRSLYDVLVRD